MKIDHIGIATKGIDEASAFWRETLGVEIGGTEEVDEQGVRVAMLAVGESRIELLEPTHEKSPIAKFLDKRGPGIHHIALRVGDIRAALNKLKATGARQDRKSTRLNSSHSQISYAVF